jgi:hypothetical protein
MWLTPITECKQSDAFPTEVTKKTGMIHAMPPFINMTGQATEPKLFASYLNQHLHYV